jgi:diguanylate cyclase (GGDEF)-like protein/PAS domain S-box-containing protein
VDALPQAGPVATEGRGMSPHTSISIGLVSVGAIFIVAALLPARATWSRVPASLRASWLTISYLMVFFVAGYLVFDAVLYFRVAIPIELVTAVVFLGGAAFVLIITRLASHTIVDMSAAESRLVVMNDGLELRVDERTLELKKSRDFVSTVLNSMSDAVSIVSIDDFKVCGVNRVFLEELGIGEAEAIGRTCHELTHGRRDPCVPPRDTCPLLETAATGKPASAEHVHHGANGELIYSEVTTSPIVNERGGVSQVVHISRDITERKRSEEKIRLLAYYDSLTGLANRTLFKELLSRSLHAARRHGRVVATLFIDMDSFKRVNDTLGHTNGDLLLQAVAKRLVNCLRKSDPVARAEEDDSASAVSRLAGDEFIVLLNDLSHANDAAVVARRILEDLAAPFMLSGHEVFASASIGISIYPLDGDDPDSQLQNADVAMHHAKEQGKNNYQFFSPAMNSSALDRLALENDLRRAVERGEFLLHYQPKVEVGTRRLIGAEALIRWRHATRGLVSPVDFIPLAEDTGLIVPIGAWVLRAACEQAKVWQAAGLAPLPISVNLSNRQFRQKDLTDTITGILRSAGLDPRQLELEITESTIMQDPENAIAALQRLKALGIGVSIDDFGTGYSSLSSLRRLPLDCLKIDRSFITNITTNGDDAAITSAIVAMAHSLKLTVLAEGVENEDQLATLRRLGCDQVQGYLFSKPLPAEAFLTILERREFVGPGSPYQGAGR